MRAGSAGTGTRRATPAGREPALGHRHRLRPPPAAPARLPGATGHRPRPPDAGTRPRTLRPAAPGRANARRPSGNGRKANGRSPVKAKRPKESARQ